MLKATEREVAQRVREVKGELKAVEARAQAIEDDARYPRLNTTPSVFPPIILRDKGQSITHVV